MKLNLNTIAGEMGDTIKGSSLHTSYNNPKLDYPLIFSPSDHRFFDNVLYVAGNEQIVNSKDKIERYLKRNPSLTFSCLCIGKSPDFCINASNCDTIWIEEGQDQADAFNTVQKIFRRFDAWEHEIGTLVERGCDLGDLAEASLKIFKNDICITDPFSRVLVHRIYRLNQLSREQTDLIKEGHYLPMSMVLDGMDDESEGESFSSFLPVFSTMQAFNCPVLRSIIPVALDYSIIFSIHSNYRNVSPKDYAPALTFATAVKRLYTAYETAESNSLHLNANAPFKELAKGKQADDPEIVRCSTALGWNRTHDTYTCFCIDFAPDGSEQSHHFMQPFISICNRIEAQFPCVAFVLDGHVTAIANLSRRQLSEQELHENMANFSKRHRLAVGAGEPYVGLDHVRNSYQQAFSALKSCHANHRTFCRFGDDILKIGMGFILKEMRPEYFCPRSLIDLARFDSDSYAVLKAYLNANCNSNAAAKQLGLQRSSFVYRLKKTKKAVGNVDFDDPDTRLLFLLSVKLIELYGAGNLEPALRCLRANKAANSDEI